MQDVIVFGSEGAKKFSATLNFLNNLAKFGLGKVVETKEGLVFMTRKESKKLEKELAKDNDDVFKIEVVVKYEELLKNKEEAAKLENFENTAKYIVASELVSEYEKTFDSILKDHERQVLEIKQKNEPGNFTEEDLSRLRNLTETKEKINVKSFNKKLNDFNEKNKDIDVLESKAKEAMEEKARIALEKMAQEALEASKKADAEAKRVQEELIKRANADQIAVKKEQIAVLEKEIRILQPENRKFLVAESVLNKFKKATESFTKKINKFISSSKNKTELPPRNTTPMETSLAEVQAEIAVAVSSGVEATVEPAVEPVVEPVVEATVEPVVEPVVEATVEPAVEPVVEPAVEPVVEPVVEATAEPAIEVKVTSTEIPSPKEYDELDKQRKDFVDSNLVKNLSESTNVSAYWVERALYATNNDLDLARNWLDDRGKISYEKPMDKKISKDEDLRIESLERKVKELELANAVKERQHEELFAKMDEMTESFKHLEKVILATVQIGNQSGYFEIPFQNSSKR